MGKLEETQAIIKIIGNTTLSAIGYVPEGGRAWSAGTFILMRTNIDAIAPFTVIGSAQPMQMSAGGGLSRKYLPIIVMLILVQSR